MVSAQEEGLARARNDLPAPDIGGAGGEEEESESSSSEEEEFWPGFDMIVRQREMRGLV